MVWVVGSVSTALPVIVTFWVGAGELEFVILAENEPLAAVGAKRT